MRPKPLRFVGVMMQSCVRVVVRAGGCDGEKSDDKKSFYC